MSYQLIERIINGLSGFYTHLSDESQREITVCENIIKHFRRALSSWKSNIPFPESRHLEDMNFLNDTISFRSLESVDTVYSLGWLNHHAGQRKLFFGLLECVLKMLTEYSCQDDDILLVYAGASGKASALLTELFPRIKILLFDPDENTMNLIPICFLESLRHKVFTDTLNQDSPHTQINWSDRHINMYIFTQKAGWFSDDCARMIKQCVFPLSQRRHLLFVSDIRASVEEQRIIHDMQSQARWAILLGADMYMLKFRLPYNESLYGSYADLSYLKDAICDTHVVAHSDYDNTPYKILYIDGNLHVQSHAPQMSAELRLMGKPSGKEKQYAFRYFDVHNIEDKMALFNLVYRSHARFVCNNLSGKYEPLFDALLIKRYAEFLATSHRDGIHIDKEKTALCVLSQIDKYFSSHMPGVTRKRFIDHLYQVFSDPQDQTHKIPMFLRTLLFRQKIDDRQSK